MPGQAGTGLTLGENAPHFMATLDARLCMLITTGGTKEIEKTLSEHMRNKGAGK